MKQNNKFLQLTLNLLKFHTYSGNESVMCAFVTEEMQRLGFKVKQDNSGNLFAIRGKADKYPLLNAHMDIVFGVDTVIEELVMHEHIKETLETLEVERKCANCVNLYDCVAYATNDEYGNRWNDIYNKLLHDKSTAITCQSYIYDENYKDYFNYSSYSTQPYYYEYSANYSKNQLEYMDNHLNKHYEIKHDAQTGRITSNKLRILGGDDKCGIAIALQVAREMPKMPMKLLFTVEEEVGCGGILEFCKKHAEWFGDVAYSLTIDRRDNDNLLMYSCGKRNCSLEFAAQLASIGIRNGIFVKIEKGTLADVIYIRKYVENCVNISAGYFNSHSLNEYVDFLGMLNIKNWVKAILEEVQISTHQTTKCLQQEVL